MRVEKSMQQNAMFLFNLTKKSEHFVLLLPWSDTSNQKKICLHEMYRRINKKKAENSV